jgi:uncharacterized glyoxalase superfamily protein PhnB
MPDLTTTTTGSTIIPGAMYRDAPAAIDWLCRVFGFERHAVYPGPDNSIMHAELTLGGGMFMLGSVKKDKMHTDGADTHGVSIIVKDADSVYAKAKAAGAGIIIDIEDKPYGGRGFTCSDPEGHVWHVGTYDPWLPK